jgi:hypothetical protein
MVAVEFTVLALCMLSTFHSIIFIFFVYFSFIRISSINLREECKLPIMPQFASKGSTHYPLSPLGHFVHLEIFIPYVQPYDLKLT